MTELRQALLSPRGVALIGASADPDKNTGRPQRYLASHGYEGQVYPVNPRRDTVQGLRAYSSVADIDGPCDQAFIMVPAAAVQGAIAECAAKGITVATIYSDRFAETGSDGQKRQDELIAYAMQHGVRILGPNSMGVIAPNNGLTLSVNAVLESTDLPKGNLGLVSQSGTILGTMLSRGAARGIGFSRLLSVGNEADIGVGELVDLLVDDDETDAILLFLEALRDAPVIAKAARRAFDAGKPVIAYKLGRSEVGQAVALSHSGALAGQDDAVEAFFRANGVVRVETLEALFEMPPLLIGQRPPKGRRVAVMTTTGGGASTVVDRLGTLGLDLIRAPDRVHETLSTFDLEVGHGPLIDLTMAGTRPGVYGAALSSLLAGDDCDAVVCVVGSSAQFHPDLAVAPIVEHGASAKKPVAGFMVPQADASLRLLADAGVAAFRTPEACADAMRALFDWREPTPKAVLENTKERDTRIERVVLDEAASLEALKQQGVPVAPFDIVQRDAVPTDMNYPVAVKALSADLPHKTEAGAVCLGIDNSEAIRDAMSGIVDRVAAYNPDVTLDRFLVSEMVKGVGEVLIGFRDDPQVGPVVVLAPGGVLAEVYGDSAIRMAPITKPQALEMIEDVRGLLPLRGYRNLPRGDMDALADALVSLSDFASSPEPPLEAEVNPLIVRAEGHGVAAVDGLVIVKG